MKFVMLALTGKGKSFDKVLKMIDNMIALLGRESQLDSSEDKAKSLDQTLSDLDKAMESAKETTATLSTEIAALIDGVKALDKSVQEATETRKAENAELKAAMAADKAAKELIGLAKNKLMQFYNSALYTPPPKMELSREQRIAVNMGSEAAPTVAPSGIAGTGITDAPAFAQVKLHSVSQDGTAPPPPPETWGCISDEGAGAQWCGCHDGLAHRRP